MEALLDPITLEPYARPILASDGETYSLDALLEAMRADPWHRSPVTGEVLRQWAFPNQLVAGFTACEPCMAPEMLFADDHLPDDGRELSWTLPVLVSAAEAVVRRLWRLPVASVRLTARVRRDHNGSDWLMHPPCALDMKEDALELGRALGIHRAVQNPWCLAGAELQLPGKRAEDLEAWWVQHVLGAP